MRAPPADSRCIWRSPRPGYDRHSICWEQHDYALKVLDGTIEDPAFFAYIAAAGQEDDWTDPEVWRKANPCVRHHDSTPSNSPRTAGKRRNPPPRRTRSAAIGSTSGPSRTSAGSTMEKWDACDGRSEDLEGKTCYAGLDLSSTTDISALVLVFPEDGPV